MNSAEVDQAIAQALGLDTECAHPWRHTTYASSDGARDGTVCLLCGKKLR